MRANAFFDTNILIYALDNDFPEKRAEAQALLKHHQTEGSAAISYQVIQECLNVVLRNFSRPFSIADAHCLLDQLLLPLCRVWSEGALYTAAIDNLERWGYSWYDSLIIASAQQAGCKTLYSEDMQHGQRCGTVTIINPFLR